MSKYTYLIDAGHGGLSNGKYVTAPAKMHKFPDGLTIYEGVINRKIAQKVCDALEDKVINYKKVYDEVKDTELDHRVMIADLTHGRSKNCIYISIHSNAGGGTGNEIFTSPGQTKSDKVANYFCEVYEKRFPNVKLRKDYADGDADKEADFKVLRKTDCPAILIENLFFDNRQEAEYLLSEKGQNEIASAIVEAIELIERYKPI